MDSLYYTVSRHARLWIETGTRSSRNQWSAVSRHARLWIETRIAIENINLISVSRHARLWIETHQLIGLVRPRWSAATRGCGLKLASPVRN